MIQRTGDDLAKGLYRLLDRYITGGKACGISCYEERLGQILLNLSCSVNELAVFLTEFLHTEDRDDILQFLISLQHLLYHSCYMVMCLSYYVFSKDSGGGFQRIHRRVNTKLNNGSGKNDICIEMAKCRCRRRVRQVIRRNIYCLNRCDRSVLGGSNTFLKFTDFVCQRRLITYSRRNSSEKCGYF